MKKNEEYVIRITDLGMEGEGIGKIYEEDAYPRDPTDSELAWTEKSETQESEQKGFAVFVKDAMVGDVIRVKLIKLKKNYAYGRLLEILEPSPDRVTPRCPKSRACGGCQIMEMDYSCQLTFKEGKVRNLLQRIGNVPEGSYQMLPIIGMEDPYEYRNKAQFPVGRGKDGSIVTGFYAGRTHTIIDTQHCYIQHPLNDRIVQIIKDWMKRYGIEPYDERTQKGLVRHILTRIGKPLPDSVGQVMVCLVICGDHLPHANTLITKLRAVEGMTSICININQENTNVILGKEVRVLWGKPAIIDTIGTLRYRISPLSFYQVNSTQTERLYQTVLEFADLKGRETVWDLYCGIGTISLFLAQKAARVYGVEVVPEAIADAKINARMNQVENAEFFVGKAEEVLPREYEQHGKRGDVLVVDPPRKGCEHSLLSCMAQMQPQKIVYVSCDPATLARDVKILGEEGYSVRKIRCVDMFPHSVHVETVVVLSRNTEQKDMI